MEQYQDVWVKGKCISRGVRECENRYKVVRDFCAQYKRPFTVLDIGANLGYFSLRLAEDFDCTVVAIESDYHKRLLYNLELNENKRVIFLHQNLVFDHLKRMANCEHFDVILCMSVIHHLPGSFQANLDMIRALGDHLIIEVPYEKHACGQRVIEILNMPDGAKKIGEGKSHLDKGFRSIYHLQNPPKTLAKRHFIANTPLLSGSLRIISDFSVKKTLFEKKNDERDWHRGINLHTYIYMSGRYPTREHIKNLLKSLAPDPPHRDLKTWNIILQGDAIQLIDYSDPNHTVFTDDQENIARIMDILS